MPQEPHRDESNSAAPWLSPGLVKSDEIVLRTVFDPEHLEPDGKLKVAAISLRDLRFKGWSVDRKKFTSLRRLALFHAELKTRKPELRRLYVLSVPASQIRKLNPQSGTQDFVVIDAAIWRNPAHAVILLSAPKTEGAARKFRNDLLESLPQYVEVARAFEASDKYGYVAAMVLQVLAILKSSLHYVLGTKP